MSDFSEGVDNSGVPMHSKRLGRELAMEFLFSCELQEEVPGVAKFEQFLETARDEFQIKDNRQARRAEEYARKRIDAQRSDEEFSALCRYTLENHGDIGAFRTKCLAFLTELDII